MTSSPSSSHLLVVEPDLGLRSEIVMLLKDLGPSISEASDGQHAMARLETEDIDVVLMAVRLPDADGLELLRRMLAAHPAVAVILLTSALSISQAVEAMRLGAFDYLARPVASEQLATSVRKALETRRLRLEMTRLVQDNAFRYGPESIIGQSQVVRDLRDEVRRIAESPATTILVQGESGTGKDLVAKAIHYASPRASRPIIPITCSAIPDTLLESELFGHERGAFTDAKGLKRGLIELADGGTVFFDEIAELGLPVQAKLLRFLEERTFRRVGGTRDLSVDVRIIAATNVRLEEAVRSGRFRDDLYFRLKVVPIVLPPLRDRAEDIPLLARHFVDHFNKKFRRRVEGLSPEALRRLMTYPWPGNIREMKNAIERVMLLEKGTIIESRMLLLTEPQRSAAPAAAEELAPAPEQDLSLERLELQALVQALERTHGNQTRAAKLLGVSRDTVRYRIRKYGIKLQTRVLVHNPRPPARAADS